MHIGQKGIMSSISRGTEKNYSGPGGQYINQDPAFSKAWSQPVPLFSKIA